MITLLNRGSLSPGLLSSHIKLAHARPKTTKSNKEFAPSLLAPCTDAHAASPAAHSPSTTTSSPFTTLSTYYIAILI